MPMQAFPAAPQLAPAASRPPSHHRRRHRRPATRARMRRNRLIAGSTLSLAAGLALYGAFGAAGPPARAAEQDQPVPTLTSLVARHVTVPGRRPVFAWPTKGQGAVSVLGIGLMGASPRERVVPIASLTKMMTAYLILRDHPLVPGEAGPSLRMTAADASAWVAASQAGDSSVPVRAGEVLTEYQLLEALLIPSADNIADLLGAWDAGSDAAFVAKMNATARRLGLRSTHYADASGVNPGSRSTAADQSLLAADLMTEPVVRAIVSQARVAFPVAGTIWNYNPALGVDGIVGVKSGFTQHAQGCLATAAFRTVGGRQVLVVSVSLGQPDGLYGAARADEALLDRATRALVPYSVVAPGARVAEVKEPGSAVAMRAVAPASVPLVVAWPGLSLDEVVVAAAPGSATARAGALGMLEVHAPLGLLAAVPLTEAPPSGTPAPGTGPPATSSTGAATSSSTASTGTGSSTEPTSSTDTQGSG